MTQFILTLLTLTLLLPPGMAQKNTAAKSDAFKSSSINKETTIKATLNLAEVLIEIWNKDEVQIYADSDDADYEMNEKSPLKFVQDDNIISVSMNSRALAHGASVIINCPAYVSLSIKTFGGDIRIKGSSSGKNKLYTAGGEIKTGDLNGKSYVHTDGGDISIGNAKEAISLSTSGGDIMAGAILAGSTITTSGGSIKLDKVSGACEISTAGGNIDIRELYGENSISTAGGDIEVKKGSGNLELTTSGGDIISQSMEGSIIARTSAGDISLGAVKGRVFATTNAGSISLHLLSISEPCTLVTSLGDIDLLLAPDLKVSIKASVKISGWWKSVDDLSDYIVTDFSGAKLYKDEATKSVKADLSLNGGGKMLLLKTSMGNISLKQKK